MANFKESMKSVKNVFLVFISLIIFFIFYEVLLRITEIAIPSFVYDDKVYGRTFKPNSDVIFKGAEGFYMGKVNEFGYLGKGYSIKKASNVIRIAILGDSYIEGMQLFERHHFKEKLEKCLFHKFNRKVEILNFGIGGIDFRDMYFNYTHKAKKFNPDIAMFYVKKSNLLNKEKFPSPEYFVENDSLQLDYSFLKSSESEMRQKFAFIRNYSLGYLLKETYENYKNGILLTKISDGIIDNKSERVGKREVIRGSKSEELYTLNKKIFENMESESLNGRIKFVLLITDDFPPDYYILLEKFRNIEKIILPAELNDHFNKDYRYWKASGMLGHWNQIAHKKVAEFLCPYFTEIINKIITSDSLVNH